MDSANYIEVFVFHPPHNCVLIVVSVGGVL
jgi:hypothetical protein